MKSAFDSGLRDKWRLKRTLRRSVDCRPIENDDIKYAFAAYRLGALAPLGDAFTDAGMTADEFKTAFEKTVMERFHGVWTLFAKTKRGFIPVGLVFAAWERNRPFMTIDGMIWFPWSSARNKVEAIVNYLNVVRAQMSMVFYVLPEHKRLYEVCAMHGVVRRVGTSYVAIPGKSCAVFETKRKT